MTIPIAHISYEVSKKWTDLVANDLRLDTSDKNRFLPPGPAANAAIAGCQTNSCTVAVGTHGKDLGVDAVVDGKRNDSVLKHRTVNAAERAEKHLFVVNTMATSGLGLKYVKKAQMTARQSLNLSQIYGNSAIGASPSITKKQKSNMAVATGVMG